MVYHVLNRGNGRMRIFHKAEDFDAFERVLAEGLERYPVELFTYCLMPNHWHLVVRPKTDLALGRWLGWVGVTHVRRYHEHYHSRGGGHLYQGRFQELSGGRGRLLRRSVPLRRGERAAGRVGRTGRGVAVVRALATVTEERETQGRGNRVAAGRLAGRAIAQLGRLGQSWAER